MAFNKKVKFNELAKSIYIKTKEGKLDWESVKDGEYVCSYKIDADEFKIELKQISALTFVKIMKNDKLYINFSMESETLLLAAERIALKIDERANYLIEGLKSL